MKTLIILLLMVCPVQGASWIFKPSTYTHQDNQRVAQYAKPEPAYTNHDPYARRWLYSYRDSNGRYCLRVIWRSYPYYYRWGVKYGYLGR